MHYSTQGGVTEQLQAYEPLRQVGVNLYCVDGAWKATAFRRRMTVVRLRDRSLVIHSAIRMSEEDLRALEQLGPVSTIIVPNVFHHSDAGFYAERYPDARVYVPAKIRSKCLTKMRVTGTTESEWPHLQELPRISLEKSLVAESVLVHLESKTLILTDLCFNIRPEDFTNRFERLVLGKWNGLFEGFGPSNATKWIAARNRKSVQKFLNEVAQHKFERVIMSHGRIVENEGRRSFLEAYARVYAFRDQRER